MIGKELIHQAAKDINIFEEDLSKDYERLKKAQPRRVRWWPYTAAACLIGVLVGYWTLTWNTEPSLAGNQSLTVITEPESEVKPVSVPDTSLLAMADPIVSNRPAPKQGLHKASSNEAASKPASAQETARGEASDANMYEGELADAQQVPDYFNSTRIRIGGKESGELNGPPLPLIVVNAKEFTGVSVTRWKDAWNANAMDYESLARLIGVDVNDIEVIKITKGTAATAIWGTKGTHGVIEILLSEGADKQNTEDISTTNK